MNVRVDLILPSEQRSASVINPKMLIRIATVVVPLIVGVVIAMAVMKNVQLSQKVRRMETTWLESEPKKEQAMKLSTQAGENEAILAEFDAWKNARITWNEQLATLQERIDPAIQLSMLRCSQVLNLVDGKTPARAFTLSLRGRSQGGDAERAVQSLQQLLLAAKPFAEKLDAVEIPRFGADPENKSHRIFDIECRYKPRMFE